MKVNGNEIKTGNIIEYNGMLCTVVKTQHVQPGKGGAYLQVELKAIKGGRKLEHRFRSDESVEKVRLDEKKYSFLFQEGDLITLMDQDSYEQVKVDIALLGAAKAFLKDAMEITVLSYDDEIIAASIPQHVIETVIEAEPVVKGQTAASSHKPAILSNGVKVMVPPHVEIGTKIVVDTQDFVYVEKA